MTEGITRQRMIMAPLEPVKLGQRYRHLPPHLTILPWFDLAVEDEPYFDGRMFDIIEEERLASVMGGDRDLFGPSNDQPVTRLCGVLLGVHCHAIRIMQELKISIDPQFTGLNYTPHVSDGSGRTVAPYEGLQLSSLAVVGRWHGREKVVESVYEWES